MSKKLIIINGTMGVGKTTISRSLKKILENSFWLDGDNCWDMNPFIANDENKKMVIENITFVLNNFIKNTMSDYIIFNWVIQTDDIMKLILDRLKLQEVQVYGITLMCSKEQLEERIAKDITCGLRDVESLERSIKNLELYDRMDTIKINTDYKAIEMIVKEIIEIIK